MTLRMKQNLLAAAPLIFSILVSGAALAATPGCVNGSAGKTVQTVLDVGDAVCDALSANDVENDDVQLVCKYMNQVDGLAHVFIAKIPATQAAKMGIKTPKTLAMTAPAPSATASASASAPPASSAPPTSAPSTKPSSGKK
jgi:hypothetical protein